MSTPVADYLLALAEKAGTRFPIVPPKPFVRPPKLRECPQHLLNGWHHVIRPEDQDRVRRRHETMVFTTDEERAAVRAEASAPKPVTYPCARCGKFAFPKFTICRWCC